MSLVLNIVDYVGLMVLNATFNNISDFVSWRSVVLVEETGENQRIKIFVEYVTLLIIFMHITSSKLSQGPS